jgi:hypothetical protein
MVYMNKPYIVKFENQISASAFDVVVNCYRWDEALAWTREYFSLLSVRYLYSDFNDQHTFHVQEESK